MSIAEEYLFVEKYRPKKVSDAILPATLKATFQSFVNSGDVPNLLLLGPPGTGKSTVAKAMLDELGRDYLFINGSLEGRNIDTLRSDMQQFAASMSFSGGRKYIVLDEADGITDINQRAIRNFSELFSDNCGFIYTANFGNRIIEPIHSRCSVVEFRFPRDEFPKLAPQYLRRACQILDAEGIRYNKKVIAELITKFFPDFRRTIHELQAYSATGEIDSGIFSSMRELSMQPLVGMLKEKRFSDVRKWVVDNADIRQETIFHELYRGASGYLTEQSTPALILALAKYQYWASFAADPQINLMAFFTEVMCDLEFL